MVAGKGAAMRDIRIEQQKAAILDELIDQAATYCAMKSSGADNVSAHVTFCEYAIRLARDVVSCIVTRDSWGMCTAAEWAEAESRLRNGECLDLFGRAVTYGAKKYGAQNWDKCKEPTRYLGAFLRHTFSHMGGEAIDKESGLNHLDCAAASLGFYIALTERNK